MKRFTELLFFSNGFYGLCVVFMSIESALFQRISRPHLSYFVALFCATVLYYTFAYAGIFKLRPYGRFSAEKKYNKRLNWYNRNAVTIFFVQIVSGILMLLSLYELLSQEWPFAGRITFRLLFLAAVFPIASVLYYGHIYFPKLQFTLRNKGLLKPFLIGFVWAGIVAVYPALIFYLFSGRESETDARTIFSFIDYWLFVSALCIMFDIKDYADDANQAVKTFVVKWGLKNTIYKILLPLCALHLLFNCLKLLFLHAQPASFLADTLVSASLCLVIVSLTKRKKIFFYLFAIDGLMLLKALAGILAIKA